MKIAILGSGNGGCTAAADWALLGHEVYLWDFEQFKDNINGINTNGGIQVQGAIKGFAKLAYAGHDLQKTLKQADFIQVIGPAYATDAFGKACRPYLEKGQIVCVSPSSGAGAIKFKNALGVNIEDDSFIISEISTLPYATRVMAPGKVEVFLKLTGGVYLSAIPAKDTEKVYHIFKLAYPHASMANSLFMTMLQTGNTIIHPSVTLLNAGRIESTKGDFYFYEDGATPATGRLIEALDNEKLALSDVLEAGIIRDTKIKLDQGYNAEESYETGYRTAPGFKGIKAQSNLDTRYMNEDVGYGLVFMSDLGRRFGVPTPVTDAMILIASIIMKRDYKKEAALTLSSLGLGDYSLEQLKALFNRPSTSPIKATVRG
jgi:opine dehydrogenase